MNKYINKKGFLKQINEIFVIECIENDIYVNYSICANLTDNKYIENSLVKFRLNENNLAMILDIINPETSTRSKQNCMVCNKEFIGEDPQYCCNGRDCGCMGMPIDPIICSENCYYSLPFKKDEYLTWIEIEKELPIYPLHYNDDPNKTIEIIVRYHNSKKEIITSAYYSKNEGFYQVDYENHPLNYVTHFMYLPKSPM